MIEEISISQLENIINNRVPIGKFYVHTTKNPVKKIKDSGAYYFLEDCDLFIAVDNSEGEAFTEEFDNYNDVVKYLS